MPFTLFPQLPTKFRIYIWQLYFESPRIHILHEAEDADADPARVLLTCTTIDASTNIPLSPCIRTDINREAQRVVLGLKQPRERVTTLTTPVRCTLVSTLRRRDERTWRAPQSPAQGGGQPPVDVDWANDLIYMCSPKSCYPFMSLVERPWAGKVQRVAAAQPWESPDVAIFDGRSRMNFDYEPLYWAMRAMPALREVSVVLVPPLEEDGDAAGSETAGPASSAAAQDTGGLTRNALGFVELADYRKQFWAGRLPKECMDMVRMSLGVVNQLERLGTDSFVTVRKLVDVDCCRVQDGEYRRRQRNLL